MNYESAIIKIMLEAGDKGLPVVKLARHVHHEVNSFFEQVTFKEVYTYVRGYVQRNSHGSSSLFQHTSRWGYYRLNMKSERFLQLKLLFDED